jgi:1-hydroxycarotenoid 3,4-desaturase
MAEARCAHRVVVVGAGIGGLVCALLLAARGCTSRWSRRATSPAARCARCRSTAPSIDAGPTVFTMRWVFDEILADAGASLDADLVTLTPLDGAGPPRLARA